MSTASEFDEFHVGTRDRLLVECYALTGDLAVARTAVRDAYAVTWHHWRAAVRSGSPEEWLRPHAYARAVRRHTTRPWHRKAADEEHRRTLAALSRLPGQQRRVLVLTHLSPLPDDDVARHVGIPRWQADRLLQAGTASFAASCGVPPEAVPGRLEQLGSVTAGVDWPAVETVRHSGATRRRRHAVVGTAAAALALVGSGLLVSGGPARPTGFEREPATTGAVARVVERADPPTLERGHLLRARQVERFDPGLRWRTATTSGNLRGDGLVVPCQAERFADPRGEAALVRTFTGSRGRTGRDVEARATEVLELSASKRSARRAYRSARGWYSGCATPRTQLLSTHELSGIGDEAALFVLRSWGRDQRGLAIGVARTGRVTVTGATELTGSQPAAGTAAAGLAAAVNRLCGAPGAGACAAPPGERSVAPLPTGQAPGMLSALDLPPVTNARGPWVGTDPQRARVNVAATRCDNTSFAGRGLSHNLTRTFLFPENTRADAFGLTQSVARTPSGARAGAFVAEVRKRIAACGRADLGTEVETIVNRSTKDQDLTLWDLSIELSDSRVLEFWMAVMRDGTAVSQLGFVSDTGLQMSREDFRAVAERALQRLPDLPRGRRSR